MKCQLPPVRVAITRKSTNGKCWKGCGEEGPSCTVVGMRVPAAAVESSGQFLEALELGSPVVASTLAVVLPQLSFSPTGCRGLPKRGG